jgi:thymidylate synthase
VYLSIPPQPDCASAWLEASLAVKSRSGHEAHNVIIGVEDPTAGATLAHPVVARVNAYLQKHAKSEAGASIECIANTIFPKTLYGIHGAPKFIQVFHERVLPKIRKGKRWSGYYFDRMTSVPSPDGKIINQLWDNIIQRINNEKNTSLNKFELSLFDPQRDVDLSCYGGQCLSFLSFKLQPGSPRTLLMTAIYRNHYYTEKLLGNLIGLGRLMEFVAAETKTKVGPLVVHSTHAEIDTMKGTLRDVKALLEECQQLNAASKKAA